jgi:FixJ family two-component response regulator
LNEVRAPEAGAEAFLQKPAENPGILAAIERALSKSERVAKQKVFGNPFNIFSWVYWMRTKFTWR